MNKNYLITTLFLTVYTTNTSLLANVSDWLVGTKEIVNHEQVLTPESSLSIENTKGNITIKTWKQNKLIVEAVKKGSQDGVEGTEIRTRYTQNGATIKTVVDDSQTKCSVDYTILIPNSTTITLAHTDYGNITIKNTQKPIKAQTHRGSITFEGISNSAHASTKHGHIKIQGKELKKEHKILAISGKGNIQVKLPEKTDAKLYAKTQKGKVTSSHPVTLEQRTMEISAKTMANLKKDVKGFIGKENGAIIKLHTSSGNVKLEKA
jgi:hypothetical protein